MILHRYIARRFVLTFLAVTSAFAAIIILVDLIEQIGELGKTGAGIPALLGLSVLHAPDALYRILPLLVLLGSVALFLALARSSELVVVRAAGRSALRALLGPAIVVLLIGVLAVAMGNPIVAATTQKYETFRGALSGERPQIAALGMNGLWLRQGDAEGQTVIRAAHANADGTLLTGVSFVHFDASGAPQTRIEATTARLTDGAWLIAGAKQWPLDADAPESDAEIPGEIRLPSSLTREQIRDSFGDPSAVPIWELPAFIQGLEQAGFTARRHQVWMQSELALPLFLLAMLLVAAAFTMGHPRGARTGLAVLVTVLTGFALYFARNFAMVLGENGQIPVALAAWAPPVAAVMLALGLMLITEDG
ncbi:MAG: LPS export ABC transporter permease LptG [Proteobacteria bacterium]|nr:MAG: LPS export ABC transporter permease LptG [Pseudomonadota bacterium]